jgi:RNA polymerase sigma-70 factor, ECF subfamily
VKFPDNQGTALDYSQLDDGALLQHIEQERTKALDELYGRYSRLVFSVALRVVGEQASAEEITLDTFTKVWEKAGTYRSERGSVRVWLASMTRNRAIDVIRRNDVRWNVQRRIWAEMEIGANTVERTPEAAVDWQWRKEQIRMVIQELSEEQRDVLALAYFQGMTQSEIAHLRNLPLGTVKTRIRSAIQKLRQLLDEEHF